MATDPRQELERLCEERREDFQSLSLMLGRNSCYIQQYLRRGVPKRLSEEDRQKLARYFGVPQTLLGGPPSDPCGPKGLIGLDRLQQSSNAEPVARESADPYLAFNEDWLKVLNPSSYANLRVLTVDGDSMAPTFNQDDNVVIDLGDTGDRLRDGIYGLLIQDSVAVRRIALDPSGQTVTVHTDNPAYPDWRGCQLGDIHPVGRIVWFGRRLT